MEGFSFCPNRVALIQFHLVSHRNQKNLFCNGIGSIPSVQCLVIYSFTVRTISASDVFTFTHFIVLYSCEENEKTNMEGVKVCSLRSEWKQLSGWMETRSGLFDGLPVRVPAAPLEALHSCELGSLSRQEVNPQPALVPTLYTSG